VKKMY